MYLWKVDRLVEDFKSEKVTQKEQFKYFLLMAVVAVFLQDPLFAICRPTDYVDVKKVSTLVLRQYLEFIIVTK